MVSKYSLAILGFTTLMGTAAMADSEKPAVTIGGFFDGYYSYNVNRPKPLAGLDAANVASAAIPKSNNDYRYYDVYHNQPTLNLAELSVNASAKEVSLLVDFDFGSFADLNASASSGAGTVIDESSKNVGQAVLSYRPASSRLSFDVGKMYSHLGVETVKSKDNFNYSRSILFSYAIPFWHTGARIGYDLIPGKLQASLYLYNGWNTQYDVNRSKTLGAQLKYTPSEKIGIVYNFVGGPERALSESDYKSVHEANASVGVTDSGTLIADVVYGSEENAIAGKSRATWSGGLIGFKQTVDDVSYLSPRYEIYRDEDGYTLGRTAQTIQSVTLTYGRTVAPGLETRIEARGDFSNQSTFVTENGTSTSQTTLLVAGLFTF